MDIPHFNRLLPSATKTNLNVFICDKNTVGFLNLSFNDWLVTVSCSSIHVVGLLNKAPKFLLLNFQGKE
ncbi:unnamed protein product [Sphenostylis stenocarpa]|uniref:Uncharacterized protein n=1 Tax=Sphenostylis stenocarpa TaxID=92480 RepID=A0AA86SEI2_9FABA|nr:unnamed protein product [Sphenostylis stenocarpa]